MKKLLLTTVMVSAMLLGCEKDEIDIEAYQVDIQEQTTEMRSTFNKLDGIMDQYEQNHNLFQDDRWRMDAVIQIVDLKEHIERIRELPEPEEFSDFHSKLLRALEDYQFVTDNFLMATDNGYENLLEQVTYHLAEGHRKVNEAKNTFKLTRLPRHNREGVVR